MIFNQLDYTEELGTGVGATIHDYGCAETDIASLLVNCFGKQTDPHQLNLALIDVKGYASNNAGAYDILDWTAVSRIYSDVTLAFNNTYPSSPADMTLIDSQLNKGCSVIVGVSFSHDVNATDPSHYVEIYKKNPDGTYQCRDPWGGLDIVFDTKYAVNGMSVAQCILQAVSYNGPIQPTVDVQQIEDSLRTARDTNWNLYQAEKQKTTDLQTQLTNCLSKPEVVSPPVTEPVVQPSTQTVEVPITHSGQDIPPIQVNQPVEKAPFKPSMRLSDLIVWIRLNILNTLKKYVLFNNSKSN